MKTAMHLGLMSMRASAGPDKLTASHDELHCAVNNIDNGPNLQAA